VSTADYEKLGAFYLGRRFDADADEVTDEKILSAPRTSPPMPSASA
jgi:hypothetical protein